MIKDYNKSMGFVDKADMIKTTYEVDRKRKKWWLRLLWHFVDVAIVNSFIIFEMRLNKPNTLDLKMFRISVVCGLVGSKSENPIKGRPNNELVVSNFKPKISKEKNWEQVAHMPLHGTSRRCALCGTRADQHRTRWYCSSCHVGLCLNGKNNCFVL